MVVLRPYFLVGLGVIVCVSLGYQVSTRESLKWKLFRAASEGKVEAVLDALRSGANVNARDPEGETPLMYASAQGRTEVVELLLNRGADIHAHSDNAETALGRAVMYNQESTISLLLEKGARVDEGMGQGSTR